MKKFHFRPKFLLILLIVLAAISLLGFITMGLWNSVLVPVLHVGMVTFWQAAGILILSKILFGGFRGRGWNRGDRKNRDRWFRDMRDKWVNMTPEEREKFKNSFKNDWKKGCREGWERGTMPETDSPESKDLKV